MTHIYDTYILPTSAQLSDRLKSGVLKMSIQAQLNDEAFSYVPNLKKLAFEKTGQERSNVIAITLREMMNCSPSVSEMTQEQITNFENRIIKKLGAN